MWIPLPGLQSQAARSSSRGWGEVSQGPGPPQGGLPRRGAGQRDGALSAFCKHQGKARLTSRLAPSPVCKPSPEVLQDAEQTGALPELAGCPLRPDTAMRRSQAELQQLQVCEACSKPPVLAREQLGGGGGRKHPRQHLGKAQGIPGSNREGTTARGR